MARVIPIKQFKSWSYTRYNDYRQCPLAAKLKHLDRVKEPENDAMKRGTVIHGKAEDYTNGKVKTLPKELREFKLEFRGLKKQSSVTTEQMWGFDRDWNPVPWDDWNNCWLRVKMDLTYVDAARNVLVVVDHKTGKYREDKQSTYVEQVELYTATGIMHYPHVKYVEPQIWYLDEGFKWPAEPVLYDIKSAAKLQKEWEKRIKPMMNDKSFKPKPGPYCRYCQHSKSKGGTCPY